jgi:hypothetical protein
MLHPNLRHRIISLKLSLNEAKAQYSNSTPFIPKRYQWMRV